MMLVIGATGKVGTHLITRLQARQRPFLTLAHSAASSQRLTAQGIDPWRQCSFIYAEKNASTRCSYSAVWALSAPVWPPLGAIHCTLGDCAAW